MPFFLYITMELNASYQVNAVKNIMTVMDSL